MQISIEKVRLDFYVKFYFEAYEDVRLLRYGNVITELE